VPQRYLGCGTFAKMGGLAEPPHKGATVARPVWREQQARTIPDATF
jgi:hypothetical protein